MQPTTPLFHKPKSIIAAKNILFACIFLTVLDFILYSWILDIPEKHLFPVALMAIVQVLILYTLTHLIGLGLKWSRIVILIFIIPVDLFYIITEFRLNLVIVFLIVLLFLLELTAMIFLFSKDSTVWFNRMAEKRL